MKSATSRRSNEGLRRRIVPGELRERKVIDLGARSNGTVRDIQRAVGETGKDRMLRQISASGTSVHLSTTPTRVRSIPLEDVEPLSA